MAAGRKEYEMLFQLNAQLGGSYSSTFTKAQSQVAAMQKEITALSKTQSDISAYQKQQSALEATRQKLLTLQQQYDNIQKEIGETEGYSSALENRLLSKQQQIEKTSASIDRQTQSLQQMESALDAAGVDTKDLENETARLSTEMEELKQKQEEVQESAEKMGASGADAIRAYQEALAASGIQESLNTVFDELRTCAEASVEFESALTGVDKTTDMSADELSEMAEAVKDLALEIPVTTDEMLAIGEVAGQLGIAKDDILDFSTTMSMLSTATTMAADEGATMLAQFANITQMDADYYDELASAIVALGNTYATTEQQITEMATGIAASASLAGMSEADMLGLSAAVSSLGIESQMGSTAVSKLISMLMTAVETGDGLEEMAHVAGMSAEQFADAWGNNAVGALESFVVGLSDTERLGQSAIVTLTDLGITETRMQRTILSLSNSGDTLTRTIATANQAWDENIALSEEAAKRYATTASQQVMMQNSFNNLRIAIGDNYTPALKELYGVANDVFASVTDFVEANPGLVKAVTAAVGVFGLATTALTAYVAVVKIAKATTALFASTIPGINVIMGVTTGIAALTAVVAGASAVASTEAEQVRELTEASREEYYQLQELESEYQRVCDAQGVHSQEADYLRWRIDELTESYEASKQTLTEYAEESDAAYKSMMAMLDANRETVAETSINEGATMALVYRLQELAAQTDQTVATQEEMKAIIAELNEVVPDLGLSYEDAVSGVTDYAMAIETAVRAEAVRQRYEQNQQAMVDALNAQYDAEARLREATDNQTAALERKKKAEAELQTIVDAAKKNDPTGRSLAGIAGTDAYKEAEAAREAYDTYTEQVEQWQNAYNEATEAYEEHKSALVDYAEATEAAESTTANLNDRIDDTKMAMEALAEAYTLAYEAAYSSVSGQYSVWDEAAKVVATSASTINTALDSQITYWQNYNSNLQSLTDRSKDIEGLSDMIASFADGSTDSVNAVAGMAIATDEELAAIVADWQTLQAEQDKVATSIAELSTNFTAEMEVLKTQLERDIEEMDLSDDAATSAKYTIQGFINGATDMLPQVQAAYAQVARAAMDAIDSTLDINSPSKEMEYRAEMTWAGYINQTREMEPEVMNAMSEAAGAGADATDIQLMTFAPQLIAALSGYKGAATEAVSSYHAAPVSIQVSFQITGDATADVVDALDRYGDEFAERVLAVVEEAGIDATRRGY